MLSGLGLGVRPYIRAVAVSGDIDRATGHVRCSPFLGWRDLPLAERLAQATGLEVTIENDVKSLAVAEQLFGDGAGVANFAWSPWSPVSAARW